MKTSRTRHANERLTQRGFKSIQIKLIELFGEHRRLPGDVFEVAMTNKAIKRVIQELDKIKGRALVIDTNNQTMITAYKKG